MKNRLACPEQSLFDAFLGTAKAGAGSAARFCGVTKASAGCAARFRGVAKASAGRALVFGGSQKQRGECGKLSGGHKSILSQKNWNEGRKENMGATEAECFS